jgi:hypothetical protein
MVCICNVIGEPFDEGRAARMLHNQRYIVGWECLACDEKWISIGPKHERCPECKGLMTSGRIQHIICEVHGCRGPQEVWVAHKMKEAKNFCAPRSVDYYVQKLVMRYPFTHARYGDGDWLTIFGYSALKNSNGCNFSVQLGEAVRQVLRDQHDYDHVLLSHPNKRFGLHIKDFLDDNGIQMEWASEWLLPAMLEGRLFPLVKQIRERPVMYIGPHRLDKRGFFPLISQLPPPPQNSFELKDHIIEEIMWLVDRGAVDTIIWSCGGGGKPMIAEIFQRTGGEITQIDFGCAFDGFFPPLPHVNPKGSRGFIRKGGYDWDELLRLNTKGE